MSRTPTRSKAPPAKVIDADKYLSVLSHFIAGLAVHTIGDNRSAQTSVPKPGIRVRADLIDLGQFRQVYHAWVFTISDVH